MSNSPSFSNSLQVTLTLQVPADGLSVPAVVPIWRAIGTACTVGPV